MKKLVNSGKFNFLQTSMTGLVIYSLTLGPILSSAIFNVGDVNVFAGDTTITTEAFTSVDDFEIKFFPFPYLRYDQGRKIICQGHYDYHRRASNADQQQVQEQVPQIAQQEGGDWQLDERKDNNGLPEVAEVNDIPIKDTYVLVEGDSNTPRLVIDHDMLDLGLGCVASACPSIMGGVPCAGVSGGILPHVEKRSIVHRLVQNYQDAKSLPLASVPQSADEIDRWQVGDSIQYATTAGVRLFVGAHAVGISVGGSFNFNGEWEHMVKKVDEYKVEVRLSNTKIVAIKARAGVAFVANMNAEYKKIFDKDHVFLFDLRYDQARQALEDMLKENNLETAQRSVDKLLLPPLGAAIPESAAAELLDPPVRYMLSDKITKNITSTGCHCGLPLLVSKDIADSNEEVYAQTLNHEDGRQTEVKMAIHKHKNTFVSIRNPFNKENWKYHRFQHTDFIDTTYGASYISTKNNALADDVPKRGNHAEILWLYSDDNANPWDIERSMDKLIRKTGMGNELRLMVPLIPKLGFVEIEFKITIGNKSLDSLVRMVMDDGVTPGAGFIAVSDGIIHNYFQLQHDPQGLCENAGDNPLAIRTCMDSHLSASQSILREIATDLLKMNSLDIDDSQRSLLVARMAKKIKSNQFVLKTILHLQPEIHVELRVRSEKFLPLEKRYYFDHNSFLLRTVQ
ncbi:MAG: hypothetical protein HQK53_06660 [Oligoflexia bacterium]|nr:hypothetical protein [Oligoflexia bacterium]